VRVRELVLGPYDSGRASAPAVDACAAARARPNRHGEADRGGRQRALSKLATRAQPARPAHASAHIRQKRTRGRARRSALGRRAETRQPIEQQAAHRGLVGARGGGGGERDAIASGRERCLAAAAVARAHTALGAAQAWQAPAAPTHASAATVGGATPRAASVGQPAVDPEPALVAHARPPKRPGRQGGGFLRGRFAAAVARA